MVNQKPDIWENIVKLAEDVCSVEFWIFKKKKMTRQTDLVDDLDLVGDDAFEFMEKYALDLDVERGDYDALLYFETEGLWLLPSFTKQREKKPLTLGMLELAAKMGYWDTESLNQFYLKNKNTD